MRPKRPARTPARQRTTEIRRDAAGIDIGARRIHVAVDPERDPRPVREFQTFTQDLYALADWLEACGVRTVAMESTGVFWIPLFQILEARGLEVCLVNAHHVKHVPGRKTDIADCQWLQYLHACGLLTASFHSPANISGRAKRTPFPDLPRTRVRDVELATDALPRQVGARFTLRRRARWRRSGCRIRRRCTRRTGPISTATAGRGR